MKFSITYIVVGAISFVLLFQAALLTIIVKPELYAPFADLHAGEDVRITEAGRIESAHNDTLSGASNEVTMQAAISRRDSTLNVLEDSVGTLLSLLEDERKITTALQIDVQELHEELVNKKIEADQSFAKIIESMNAEDAVRVLSTLDDYKVRSVLLTVNRRQAARILSNIEPDRAARIMNYSTDGSD